jgi:hypothetical protein
LAQEYKLKVASNIVPYEDIVEFLALYAFKYLRSESDGKVPIFDDICLGAYERVSNALYKLEILEPATPSILFRRWRFISGKEDFKKIAADNFFKGEKLEYLIKAVVGLAAQDGTDSFSWRETSGPIGIPVETAETLVKLGLCYPSEFETKASYFRTFIEGIPPESVRVEYQKVNNRLQWTEVARKYF